MSNLRDDLISNISYTNKDFESVYNELLDLVTKITNKWDPSHSNESDPGVLLLKLLAIVADKNNYNIDKNVLECFPLSVTQEGNARNLYDSLGYNMKWYESALATNNEIGFKCLDNSLLTENNNEYVIPAFTPLTDSSNTIVYTTLKSTKLTNTSDIFYTPCIQGTAQTYMINNIDLITVNNLDSERKLYFTEKQIAENGIFIADAGTSSSINDVDFYTSEWHKVDNLTSYPSSNKVYQFGITVDTNTCYIQFPEDISNLANNGLYIKYIISDGVEGNVKSNILSSFLNDLGSYSEEKSVNDNIYIYQTSAITSGKDPETLEEAYKNYKKTIGTFDTLITRRDYENFINRLGEVGNCVVSDRTNDINFTDYIQKWGPSYDVKTLVQNENISVFDIYLYLCKFINNVNSLSTYENTFEPDNDATTLLSIESSLDEIKAVQHNIEVPKDSSLIFNFDNRYRINATLNLQYNVTNIEKKDIEKKIRLALMNKYNSKELEYGVELDNQDVINTIMEADDRIKNVILSSFDYNTYERTFANLESLLTTNTPEGLEILNKLVARMILAGNVQLYKYDDDFDYEFGQENGEFYDKISKITTTDTYTLSTSSQSIRDNAVIELWADNYTTKQRYGAYTKISYSGEPIPANILFTLDSPIDVTYYDENTKSNKPTTIPSGSIIQTNINITTNTDNLGANGIIEIKEIDSESFVSGTEYLAIFNSNQDLTLSDSNNDYILQENEYLIIPNSSRTGILTYGKGTKLSVELGVTLTLINSAQKFSQINSKSFGELEWNLLTQELIKTATITYSFDTNTGVSISSALPNPINNTSQSLEDRSFYYQLVGETSSYEIKSTTLQPYFIRSRLNINSTKLTPQKLNAGQTFEITYNNGATDTIGEGTTIEFSENVVMAGGVNLDMGVLQIDGDDTSIEYLLKGYSYTVGANPPTRENNVITIDANVITPDADAELKFDFSDGNTYLVPVDIYLDSGVEVTFSTTDGTISEYQGSSITTIDESGKKILMITGENLNISFSSSIGNSKVQIGHINKQDGLNSEEIDYKDLNQEYKISTQENAVLGIMQSIDTHNEFDWTYRVPQEDKVLQPTAQASFWNTNHIANNYTLPMIDFTNSEIVVSASNII